MIRALLLITVIVPVYLPLALLLLLALSPSIVLAGLLTVAALLAGLAWMMIDRGAELEARGRPGQ